MFLIRLVNKAEGDSLGTRYHETRSFLEASFAILTVTSLTFTHKAVCILNSPHILHSHVCMYIYTHMSFGHAFVPSTHKRAHTRPPGDNVKCTRYSLHLGPNYNYGGIEQGLGEHRESSLLDYPQGCWACHSPCCQFDQPPPS